MSGPPATKSEFVTLASGITAIRGKTRHLLLSPAVGEWWSPEAAHEFASAAPRRFAAPLEAQGSSRTQILRKLIGALGSPCAWSRIGDGPCALYQGAPMYCVVPFNAKLFWTSTPL